MTSHLLPLIQVVLIPEWWNKLRRKLSLLWFPLSISSRIGDTWNETRNVLTSPRERVLVRSWSSSEGVKVQSFQSTDIRQRQWPPERCEAIFHDPFSEVSEHIVRVSDVLLEERNTFRYSWWFRWKTISSCHLFFYVARWPPKKTWGRSARSPIGMSAGVDRSYIPNVPAPPRSSLAF